MHLETDLARRCAKIVTARNHEQGWGLTPAQERQYSAEIVHHLPTGCSDEQLQSIVDYYHSQHPGVAVLRAQLTGDALAGWQAWQNHVSAILRYANLLPRPGMPVELNDLIQIASEAVLLALPTYHYRSLLSTWSYKVITNSVRRYLRDQGAAKRSGQVGSLDQQGASDVPDGDGNDPALQAQGNLLTTLIDEIIDELPDQRIRTIMRLWLYEDKRLADIGRAVGLSQSRVSILLERERTRLRNHPKLREWHNPNRPEPDQPEQSDE